MSLRSVLIIDDNEVDRMLLKRQLIKGEITDTIFEAEDGEDALDFLLNDENKNLEDPSKFPPILAFLDINMPQMDGFEFLEKFSEFRKSKKEHQTVMFTMLSSSSDEKEIERALSYDFVKGFLVKGSNKDHIELKNFIKRHFPEI